MISTRCPAPTETDFLSPPPHGVLSAGRVSIDPSDSKGFRIVVPTVFVTPSPHVERRAQHSRAPRRKTGWGELESVLPLGQTQSSQAHLLLGVCTATGGDVTPNRWISQRNLQRQLTLTWCIFSWTEPKVCISQLAPSCPSEARSVP